MSASSDLQLAIEATLAASGVLRQAVPIVKRREKDLAARIEEAVAMKSGLAILIHPVVIKKATYGTDFVFCEDGELRVTCMECPLLNQFAPEYDVYDLGADVRRALQGGSIPDITETPIYFIREDYGAFTVSDGPLEGRQLRALDEVFTVAFEEAPRP